MKKTCLQDTGVADDIKHTVDDVYDAFPDRTYIVGNDGKIALQGAPGPMGFTNTIKKVKKWLRDYSKAQKETAKEKKTTDS